jgi:hypothetical protein
MNRLIVPRMSLALLSVGLVVFSLTPNLPTNAQGQDTCPGLGWEPYHSSEVDLAGTGLPAFQNSDCSTPAKWQFVFNITITRDDKTGKYMGHVGSEEPQPFQVEGSSIKFLRKLNASHPQTGDIQTWRGRIQRHQNGGIRIYGTWSGAFDDTNKDTKFNHDLMIIIK